MAAMTATVTIWSAVLFTSVILVIAIYAKEADIASAIAPTSGFSASASSITTTWSIGSFSYT
jgi:hypothetical protein